VHYATYCVRDPPGLLVADLLKKDSTQPVLTRAGLLKIDLEKVELMLFDLPMPMLDLSMFDPLEFALMSRVQDVAMPVPVLWYPEGQCPGSTMAAEHSGWQAAAEHRG
jgi:hypothetical protein